MKPNARPSTPAVFHLQRRSLSACVAAALGFFAAAGGAPARGQTITEFPIRTGSISALWPMGITTGPDGNLWFTEYVASAIGRMTPAGGVTEFVLPRQNSYPAGIVTGPDGNLWFTEAAFDGRIGRITPGGAITEFTVPTPDSIPMGIATGPDGNLWFTENAADKIGRATTSGAIVEFAVPRPQSLLGGIAAGPDGNLWFTEGGANNRIGRITPAGVVAEFTLPETGGQAADPVAITTGPDGNLWFTEFGTGRIGRMTTNGQTTEFDIPTANSLPAGIAAGPDGNLWFTEFFTYAQKIGRITTTGVITEYTIPSAYPAPLGVASGPDGNVWFTEANGNRIGRVDLSASAACQPDALTLCLGNGRFALTADYRRAPDGPSAPALSRPQTDDTGDFWFFDADNIEVVVKVLDGCGVDGAYWVFAAGLTNLGVEIRVFDTRTGTSKDYANAWGTPFQPIQDVNAFPCH